MSIIYDHYILDMNTYQVAKKHNASYSTVRNILRVYYLFGIKQKNNYNGNLGSHQIQQFFKDNSFKEKYNCVLGPVELRSLYKSDIFRCQVNGNDQFELITRGPVSLKESNQRSICPMYLYVN